LGCAALAAGCKATSLSLPADGVRQAVQAVADDSVDALDASGGECLNELVSDTSCHGYSPA